MRRPVCQTNNTLLRSLSVGRALFLSSWMSVFPFMPFCSNTLPFPFPFHPPVVSFSDTTSPCPVLACPVYIHPSIPPVYLSFSLSILSRPADPLAFATPVSTPLLRPSKHPAFGIRHPTSNLNSQYPAQEAPGTDSILIAYRPNRPTAILLPLTTTQPPPHPLPHDLTTTSATSIVDDHWCFYCLPVTTRMHNV